MSTFESKIRLEEEVECRTMGLDGLRLHTMRRSRAIFSSDVEIIQFSALWQPRHLRCLRVVAFRFDRKTSTMKLANHLRMPVSHMLQERLQPRLHFRHDLEVVRHLELLDVADDSSHAHMLVEVDDRDGFPRLC